MKWYMVTFTSNHGSRHLGSILVQSSSPGEALLRCKLLNLCPTEGELRIGLVKPSALKPSVTEAKERLLSQDQFGVLFEHVYASGGSIFEDSLYEGVP